MYKLIIVMNIKTLQIIMMAAMGMGNAMATSLQKQYSKVPEEDQSSKYAFHTQQDMGNNCNRLYVEEILDGSEAKNIRSWEEKLCNILNCRRSEIEIYHFSGKKGNRGDDSLSRDDIVSSIAALSQLKCGKSDACLNLENFIARTNSVNEKLDWQGGFDPKAKIKVCYVPQNKTTRSDEHAPFDKVASAIKIPVIVIDDIYNGNFLGDRWGGFKNFFNRFKMYSGYGCETVSAKFFFDDDVLEQLKIWSFCWKTGVIWLFAIYQGNVYGIYFKNA
jgi:hypothetical protein